MTQRFSCASAMARSPFNSRPAVKAEEEEDVKPVIKLEEEEEEDIKPKVELDEEDLKPRLNLTDLSEREGAPASILSYIPDQYADLRPALSRCCLVNRAFLPLARQLLYKSISIHIDSVNNKNIILLQPLALSRILAWKAREHADLTGAIDRGDLRGIFNFVEHSQVSSVHDLLSNHFPPLPNLRTLELAPLYFHISPRDRNDWKLDLAGFSFPPSLTRLILYEKRYFNTDCLAEGPNPPPFSVKIAQFLPSLPPSLTTLILVNAPLSPLLDHLLVLLQDSTWLLRLERLQLHGRGHDWGLASFGEKDLPSCTERFRNGTEWGIRRECSRRAVTLVHED
ncbi:hypothetical protein JCM8547_006086 [Rhodosporidiobolus lusitaniae]